MSTGATSVLDGQLGRLFASDPELLADRSELYGRLVSDHPVHSFGPFLILSDHARVRRAYVESDLFRSSVQREGSRRELLRRELPSDEHREMFDYVTAVEQRFLTFTDGEPHDRIRDVSRRLFTPRRIAALEARTQEVCDALFEEMTASDGPADFAEFSYRLPALIIAEMLGVPAADADELIRWGDEIMGNMFGGQGVEALEAAVRAHRSYDVYVGDIISRWRDGDPATELVDLMLAASGEGIVDDAQLSAQFREMVLGGFETTRVVLAGTCLELLSRPEQWSKLVADPGLASNLVEEGLRHVTPIQWNGRVASQPTEIEGIEVAAGTTVLLMLAAGNRDPKVFPRPDDFEIERANAKQHLSFGLGRHYCLGQALARLESRIAFETMARRFPQARLAIDPQAVAYTGQMAFRRVESLPIELGADHT